MKRNKEGDLCLHKEKPSRIGHDERPSSKKDGGEKRVGWHDYKRLLSI